MKNSENKKKAASRSSSKQIKRTETYRQMLEVATGEKPKSMRGRHFRFERHDLYKAILIIYNESPKDFYNQSEKFVIARLQARVQSYFEHNKLNPEDFYASNEKAIKEEIKNLLNSGKIKTLLKSETD